MRSTWNRCMTHGSNVTHVSITRTIWPSDILLILNQIDLLIVGNRMHRNKFGSRSILGIKRKKQLSLIRPHLKIYFNSFITNYCFVCMHFSLQYRHLINHAKYFNKEKANARTNTMYTTNEFPCPEKTMVQLFLPILN